MNKEFENKVRLIHDYFHSYGIRKMDDIIHSHEEMVLMFKNKTKKANFVKFVHEGYRKGQHLLIQELINNEKEIKNLKVRQKDLRRSKKYEEANNLNYELDKLKYEEYILRNLADSLAWLLMKGQHWIARRWFSGSVDRPSLLNSNIESLHIVAENYYKNNPNGFVLYTDLTSFIDIADLIIVSEDLRLQPVEVKEGSKSNEVLSFIDNIMKNEEFKPEDIELDKFENPKKFFDQVERTIKQINRGSRLTKLLKEEMGPDPFTGQNTIIGELKEPLRFYHEEVYNMFKELESSIWSHRVIEGVIHIGMYKEGALAVSEKLFKETISLHFIEDYPIISYNSMLRSPIKEPVFQKPYGLDNIMNLVFGKTRMLLCVNINALLNLFEKRGVRARWLTRKETQKIKDKGFLTSPFEYKYRAISVGEGAESIVLGDQFLSRLVYDSLLPESLVAMYCEKLSIHEKKENE